VNASMLTLSLLLAYAGMLFCCLGMERHWKQLSHPRLPAVGRRACKPLGILLLGLAVYAASAVWPGGMAMVGWFGLISLAGLGLLMFMPYAPRLVLWLPLAGLGAWLLTL
jgi:hypothetical protein